MRINKSFKFSRETVKYLETLSKKEGVSQTRIIENLLLKEVIKKGLET